MKTCTNLDDIAAGSRVVVDANILIYHFAGASVSCRRFVERCHRQELIATLPSHTGLEVLHRLMALEAVESASIGGKDVVKKLAERPEVVEGLRKCYANVALIPRLGIEVVDTPAAALQAASSLCMMHGLLANDAALLATMESLGVNALASADRHFGRVPHLTVYSPLDL
ncbi:MAG: type II toxin-antitoxin system VapC family toxin [Candidatus Xenobia bacterium]